MVLGALLGRDVSSRWPRRRVFVSFNYRIDNRGLQSRLFVQQEFLPYGADVYFFLELLHP